MLSSHTFFSKTDSISSVVVAVVVVVDVVVVGVVVVEVVVVDVVVVDVVVVDVVVVDVVVVEVVVVDVVVVLAIASGDSVFFEYCCCSDLRKFNCVNEKGKKDSTWLRATIKINSWKNFIMYS